MPRQWFNHLLLIKLHTERSLHTNIYCFCWNTYQQYFSININMNVMHGAITRELQNNHSKDFKHENNYRKKE